jgi:P-type Ca2+ transporter type 2C
MLCPTRKIDISQYPKFLGFPAEHGGGSADDDHSEHDVWPEQPFECDADIVYQYINGRHVYFLSDLARIHRVLMIGPPSQSLGVDPVDPAIMRKPPRKKDESIITRRLLYRVLFSASIIVIGTLCVYIFALSDDHVSRREQTMVKSSFPHSLRPRVLIHVQTFTSFVFLDLVSAIQNRGLGCGLTQNKMLILTVSVSFLAQLALVYVPFMQAVFKTEALEIRDLSMILALALVSMVLHEGRRVFERKLNAETTYASITEEMA